MKQPTLFKDTLSNKWPCQSDAMLLINLALKFHFNKKVKNRPVTAKTKEIHLIKYAWKLQFEQAVDSGISHRNHYLSVPVYVFAVETLSMPSEICLRFHSLLFVCLLNYLSVCLPVFHWPSVFLLDCRNSLFVFYLTKKPEFGRYRINVNSI